MEGASCVAHWRRTPAFPIQGVTHDTGPNIAVLSLVGTCLAWHNLIAPDTSLDKVAVASSSSSHLLSRTMDMQGAAGKPDEATLVEARTNFLSHCASARGLSHHTLRAYLGDLRSFSSFAKDIQFAREITHDLITQYLAAQYDCKRLRATTIRRRVATIKVFVRWLEARGLACDGLFHASRISVPLPRRLPRALTFDEARRLLRHSASRVTNDFDAAALHFAVTALFTTGLRVGELVQTRLMDVTATTATITVRGKGNRERRVFMSGSDAKAILKQYIALRTRIPSATDRLLVYANGRPFCEQGVRRRLAVLARRSGIARRVTPHMLRHTAATQLLEAGVDIRLVQTLLGHATISTTQLYTHVTDESLRHRLARANTLARVLGVPGR
jgi:Site-specific recombinase XerD